MTDEEKERERENKIRDMIEWIDNDLLRASKYLLFLKEENEYLKIKVVGGYQIEKMKRCGNCKHEALHLVCVGVERCTDFDKWELAE